MLKKFENPYDEGEFRAARALLWCALEGTEVADTQVALYRVRDDLLGVGDEEGAQAVLEIMERQALGHAREYLEDRVWGWDHAEKHNFLILIRHLRSTGEVHPELVERLHI